MKICLKGKNEILASFPLTFLNNNYIAKISFGYFITHFHDCTDNFLLGGIDFIVDVSGEIYVYTFCTLTLIHCVLPGEW